MGAAPRQGSRMLYTPDDVMPRTRVYDVDTKERIDKVVAINATAGWIQVADQPLRVTDHYHIATRRIRFGAIHPIQGLEPLPCLFHCYGRKQ